MDSEKRLVEQQKSELKTLIKRGKDGKEVRRVQAILLVNNNAPYETITELTGSKERTVLTLRQRYLKDDLASIENKQKGRPKCLLKKETEGRNYPTPD